jgi:putative membrane protein
MRTHRLIRQLPYFAAGALALAACKPTERAADTAAARADSAMRRADTAVSRGDVYRSDSARMANDSMANRGARGGWTENSIVAYTTAANTGEIEEARLATKKATNPAVKAFARELLADHQAMLADGKSLASRLKITADSTAGDARDLVNHARDELNDMTNKPAGADWDRAFIDNEIDGHQHVLDKLQDAAKNTNNAELRAALEKASGKVQQHLTKAQDIKANKLKS